MIVINFECLIYMHNFIGIRILFKCISLYTEHSLKNIRTPSCPFQHPCASDPSACLHPLFYPIPMRTFAFSTSLLTESIV